MLSNELSVNYLTKKLESLPLTDGYFSEDVYPYNDIRLIAMKEPQWNYCSNFFDTNWLKDSSSTKLFGNVRLKTTMEEKKEFNKLYTPLPLIEPSHNRAKKRYKTEMEPVKNNTRESTRLPLVEPLYGKNDKCNNFQKLEPEQFKSSPCHECYDFKKSESQQLKSLSRSHEKGADYETSTVPVSSFSSKSLVSQTYRKSSLPIVDGLNLEEYSPIFSKGLPRKSTKKRKRSSDCCLTDLSPTSKSCDLEVSSICAAQEIVGATRTLSFDDELLPSTFFDLADNPRSFRCQKRLRSRPSVSIDKMNSSKFQSSSKLRKVKLIKVDETNFLEAAGSVPALSLGNAFQPIRDV